MIEVEVVTLNFGDGAECCANILDSGCNSF